MSRIPLSCPESVPPCTNNVLLLFFFVVVVTSCKCAFVSATSWTLVSKDRQSGGVWLKACPPCLSGNNKKKSTSRSCPPPTPCLCSPLQKLWLNLGNTGTLTRPSTIKTTEVCCKCAQVCNKVIFRSGPTPTHDRWIGSDPNYRLLPWTQSLVSVETSKNCRSRLYFKSSWRGIG